MIKYPILSAEEQLCSILKEIKSIQDRLDRIEKRIYPQPTAASAYDLSIKIPKGKK